MQRPRGESVAAALNDHEKGIERLPPSLEGSLPDFQAFNPAPNAWIANAERPLARH